MNQTTYAKGDLVQIPAEVYLFKTAEVGDEDSPVTLPIRKTKKPQVGIFVGYKTNKQGRSFAKVMCSDTTWLVDLPSVHWMEEQC